MPIVFIPTPWRDLTGGLARVEVEGRTVGEVVDALEHQFPGIQQRLCRGASLAPGLQVVIGDAMTLRGLRASVQPESEVHFLPAIGGG
jgi:molybdopterin synthase sulfur carrier subunit